MGKAKTASKNNPTARESARVYKDVSGQVIKPAKYIGPNGSYMAAQYETGGALVVDRNGVPFAWKKLKKY